MSKLARRTSVSWGDCCFLAHFRKSWDCAKYLQAQATTSYRCLGLYVGFFVLLREARLGVLDMVLPGLVSQQLLPTRRVAGSESESESKSVCCSLCVCVSARVCACRCCVSVHLCVYLSVCLCLSVGRFVCLCLGCACVCVRVLSS